MITDTGTRRAKLLIIRDIGTVALWHGRCARAASANGRRRG
jgi:hypothetical protein